MHYGAPIDLTQSASRARDDLHLFCATTMIGSVMMKRLCWTILIFSVLVAMGCDSRDRANVVSSMPFEHPLKLYIIERPTEWDIINPPKFGPGPVAKLTRSPELTVSHNRMDPDEKDPDFAALINNFFPNETPASDLTQETLTGCSAVNQEFTGMSQGKPWRWGIRILRCRGHIVVSTVSDESERFAQNRDAYFYVLKSAEIRGANADAY